MPKDKILQRIYIKGILTTESPLILGSGEEENSDIDLVRDWDKIPFIPGTSISGAIRHYLDEIVGKTSVNGEMADRIISTFFGEKMDDSRLSLITFYDCYPVDPILCLDKIQTRDGVRIEDIKKTAEDKGKFEYEILEPGVKFDFRAEVVFREIHELRIPLYKNLIYVLLDSMKNGNVRMGAKSRRGFGKLGLDNIQILDLDMLKPDDAQTWIDFDWNNFPQNGTIKNLEDFVNPMEKKLNPDDGKRTIHAEFSIPYSINIRNYSTNPTDPDSVHLTCNGKSTIPGTSWTGVIRHTLTGIGREIGKTRQIEDMITELFGWVKPEQKKYEDKQRASRISVEESYIDGGKSMSYTRNKVDRFTGKVVDSALFEESPHYGGKVSLDILIGKKKSKPEEKESNMEESLKVEDHEIGLILLALKDIGNGISPVGGESNVGRGILKVERVLVDGYEFGYENSDNKYFKALAAQLQ